MGFSHIFSYFTKNLFSKRTTAQILCRRGAWVADTVGFIFSVAFLECFFATLVADTVELTPKELVKTNRFYLFHQPECGGRLRFSSIKKWIPIAQRNHTRFRTKAKYIARILTRYFSFFPSPLIFLSETDTARASGRTDSSHPTVRAKLPHSPPQSLR